MLWGDLMKDVRSVLVTKEYGQINLKLKEVLKEKNLTRNALARAVDTRFEVIDKWYNNNVEKLDLDVLARICFVLDCEISDIIDYTL